MGRRWPSVLVAGFLLAAALTAALPGRAMAAGGALQFDGNDDVVSIPNTSGSLNFGTTFTVEAWVKP